jgi:hypothetical protein
MRQRILYQILQGIILIFFVASCNNLPTPEPVHLSWIEGELVFVSTLPDAVKSNYPNCNYTAIIKVKHILAGDRVPGKLILVLPGFRDRKNIAEAEYRLGQKLKIQICDFDEMPQKFRQTQQADDNENFELRCYGAIQSKLIRNYTFGNNLPPYKNKANRTWLNSPLNPPLDAVSRKIRKQQMNRTLKFVQVQLFKQHLIRNDLELNFSKWKAGLDNSADVRNDLSIPGKYLAKWARNSFFTLPLDAWRYPFPKNPWVTEDNKVIVNSSLPQIKALNEFLAFHNIDLVVALLPSSYDLSLPVFCPSLNEYRNIYTLQLAENFIKHGIDVVYLHEPLSREKFNYQLMFQYHRNNAHPHSGVVAVAGQALAAYLDKRKYITQRGTVKGIVEKVYDSKYSSTLWALRNGRFPLQSSVESLVIKWQQTSRLKNRAEVLIAGNSFSTYPVANGDIGNFISYYGKFNYDWLGGEAGASTIPQKLLSAGPGILKGKKAVVLFVARGHLTAYTWQNINLLKMQQNRVKLSENAYSSSDRITAINSKNKFIDETLKENSQSFTILLNNKRAVKLKIKIPESVSATDICGIKIYFKTPQQNIPIIARSVGRLKTYSSGTAKQMSIAFEHKLTQDTTEINVELATTWHYLGMEITGIELCLTR